jgi:alkylation response protein AidB-like acyl-CoA dehydrogenase
MLELLEEYRSFLRANLPADYGAHPAAYRQDAELRAAFQVGSFEAGWLMPEWPREHGGRNLALPEAIAIRIEGARRQIPRQMNIQGTGVVAPALRQFGTPEQQERYLRPTLRGEAWWALGMSEPGAGSDLAALRTRASRDERGWIVNGQKIWTTQADSARWCTLYVRTDSAKPKHRGITCLLLDMHSPGVDVRRIRTAGPTIDEFCEVFLDDVVIPADDVLGDVDGGWRVAMSALEHERDMIWINNWLETRRALEPVLQGEVAPHQLERLGRLLADLEAIRLTGLRSVASREVGLETPVAGILKLLGSETVQRAASFALDLGIDSSARGTRFGEVLESLAASIYGGTSEIQRNIIAERILGLPKGT